MRRRDLGAGLAFVLIMSLAPILIISLGMAGGTGEALLGRTAIGGALLWRTATWDSATTATGDSGAGAAPVILEVIATDERAHAPVEGLMRDDFEILEGRSVAQITSFAHGSEGALRPLTL